MKVDRLVSIIMILLDKERVSAQELAAMFEISPRTVYRDIDAIGMAGIPVRSIPGTGGGDRKGNQTPRSAEPYRLVLKSSHWYFQGYCHTRNDYRLFRLSRISDLQLETQTFTPRDCPKPQLKFADTLEAMQTRIKIRIHQSVMDRVLDYCNYEDCSPDGNEHYIVHFPFVENEYYYGILLSFGDKCECLEPLHIRKEIRRKIQDIGALYDN